jgi:hypothetical protein
LAYKVLLSPRPFWIHYYDPEVAYFWSGFSLLAGQRPINVEHPGTPLQLLSALLVWGLGRDPLAIDQYRAALYTIGLLANALAALCLLRTVLAGLPWQLQTAALWTYWLAPQSLEYLGVVSPEMFYLPAATLVLGAGWKACEDLGNRARIGWWGVSIGLGVALKFTQLAWLPGAVGAMLLGRVAFPAFGWLLGGVCVGFVLGTAPVIHAYPYIFSWLTRFATHSGEYGTGTAALPSSVELVDAVSTAVRSSKAWHVWTLCAGALAVAEARAQGLATRQSRMVVFAMCTGFAVYAMALRHFVLRYIALAGTVSLLLAALAARRPSFQKPVASSCALVIAGILVVKTALVDARAHAARIREVTELRSRIEGILAPHRATRPGLLVAYSYRAPEPSYPLLLWAPEPALAEQMHQRYPNRAAYNPWRRQVVTPEDRTWDALVIRRDHLPTLPRVDTTPIGAAGDYVVLLRRWAGRASPP